MTGVSRTSVRDAVNKLAAIGLVEQKQGQSTFVRSTAIHVNNLVAVAVETQNSTLPDLLEVRMGLAAMAARKATDKDISFLKKSLEEMREEISFGRRGTKADVSFHMAIS